MHCVDRGVSRLHEAERREVDDQFFAVVDFERFLQLQVVLPSNDLLPVPDLKDLVKERSHVAFILPAQFPRDPLNDLEGHLRFLHPASRLQVEHKLEEVVDQIDVEHVLPEDPIIQE